MSMQKKIVIFGTGNQAMKDFYTLRMQYDIQYFLDNDKNKVSFCGRNVIVPDDSNIRSYPIVVCTNDIYYLQIAEQLKTYGLEELKDFYPSGTLGKKTVIVHGNCHTGILKQFMMSSPRFLEKYWIYPLPSIHYIRKGYIDDDILKNCDVFIHQDIRINNSQDYKLSDEYIVPRLSKKCINITIPNLYTFGKVFFPQTTENKNSHSYYGDKWGMFPAGDENVERLLREGVKDIEQILKIIRGGSVQRRTYKARV